MIIALMMFLTRIDVVLRYIFNSPIPGVYTLSEMFMIAAVFPAVAYVQQKKGHVRVDILIDKLKGRPRIVFELATLFLALVCFAIMGLDSGLLAWNAWVTGDYDMGSIEIPFWPAKSVMTVGIGLLLWRFITDIGHHVAELRKRGSFVPDSLFMASLIPLLFPIFLALVSPGQSNPTTVGQ